MRNGAMLTHTVLRWWNPRQCKPKQGQLVVATIDYKVGSCTYTRELAILTYWKDTGYEFADGSEVDDLVVHAWADLEPYGGD
jgi:hypothetical protein